MKIKNDYRADAHARTSETTLLSLELRRLTTFSEFPSEAILARLHLATRAEITLYALETLGWLRWPTKRPGQPTDFRTGE
jgi:hypothetical protein